MATAPNSKQSSSALQPRTVRELLEAAAAARPIGSEFVRVRYTGRGTLIHVLPPGESTEEEEEGGEMMMMSRLFFAGTPFEPQALEASGGGSDTSGSGSEASGSGSDSSDSDPSGSGSDSSGSGSDSDSSSSKMAIVELPPRVEGEPSEWIAWHCSERPEATFEDVIDVPVAPTADGLLGGTVELAPEWRQGVESTEVLSTMALGAPVETMAEALPAAHRATLIRATAAQPRDGRPVTAVRVRIAGRRQGSPEQWRRHTAEEAASNTLFYQTALRGEIL